MTVIYHLHADHKNEWSPSHPDVESSKRFVQEFLREHTGIRIDYPTHREARVPQAMSLEHVYSSKENQHDFLFLILTILKENDRDCIITLKKV